MKLFLTGGTGFLGQSVLRQLAQAGHQVYALTRDSKRVQVRGVEAVTGDISNVSSWEEALKGVDACIHMIGILREHRSQGVTFQKAHYQATVDMVKACQRNGISRFIHVSANGVEKSSSVPYMRTKALGEQAVQSSGLDWTILRPGLVYAGEVNEQNFIRTLRSHLDALPMFPYFGDGSYRMSPISAPEVAESIVASLTKPESIRKIYHLCGPETYTYKAMLHMLNEVGKYRCSLFSVPMWLATQATGLLGNFSQFPITADMVRMLAAGNEMPTNALGLEHLGVHQRSFRNWLETGVLPEPPPTPVLGANQTVPLSTEEAPPKTTQPLMMEDAPDISEAVTKPLMTEDAPITTQPLQSDQAPEV